MISKSIYLKNISFLLPHKSCFSGFNATIPFGSRIAISGQNGCGKSSLLKIIQGILDSTDGEVIIPQNYRIGYIE